MKDLIGINDIKDVEIALSDIVGEAYRNGYWLGIVDKPSYYPGSRIAIRILDHWEYYFHDYKIDGAERVSFHRGNTYELLHSNVSGNYDVHPSRIRLCQLKLHMKYCDLNKMDICMKEGGELVRGGERKWRLV